jgi:hypothetical protein
MQSGKPSLYIILLVLGALGVLGCLLAPLGLKAGLDFWESQALNRLANRLGVESSWEGFRDYLDSAFVIGMTKAEVLSEANKIGPHKITPMTSASGQHKEAISFDYQAMGFHPLVSNYYSYLEITYDELWRVINVYRQDPRDF